MKAISHVVAIILLIILTVAVTITFYLWLTGSTFTTGIREEKRDLLKIEGVSTSAVSSGILYVTIYIRNIGTTRQNITAVYFEKGSTTVCDSIIEGNPVVNPNTLTILKVYPKEFLNSGKYSIKVVTESGVQR